MKRKTRIICMIIALVLVAALLSGIIVSVAYATAPFEKSETVYITTDGSGAPLTVLSSVYLTNPQQKETINDTSVLMDIKCIGTIEAPAVNGTTLVFQSKGEDVAYQGNAKADALPFTMHIEYTLDGQKMSPQSIAGKSGHVQITVSYENKHLQETMVEDEKISMYTPFTIITSCALNERFSNVSCVNGKVMMEAGVASVMGVTFPGLAYSLNAKAEGRLSESFTIEADVTDFELDGMTAIVMTGIVETDDISDLDDLSEMIDGVDAMGEAGNELEEGVDALRDGVNDFDKGLNDYIEGIEQLSSGLHSTTNASEQISSGMHELNKGISDLYTGVAQMVAALQANIADMQVMANQLSAQQQQQIDGMVALTIAQIEAAGGTVNETTMQTVRAAIEQAFQANAAGQQLQNMASSMQTASSQVEQLQSAAMLLSNASNSLTIAQTQLKDGILEVDAAVAELVQYGDDLKKASGKIRNAMSDVYDGVQQLNEEGIQELLTNTQDINVALKRKDAVTALGEAYQTFSGLPENCNGTVKFVVTTESIYQPKEIVQNPVEDETLSSGTEIQNEMGFFQRIWNWIKSLFGA